MATKTFAEGTNATTKCDSFNIDPRNIVVIEGFNSRQDFGDLDELASQIKENGLLNPISVVPYTDENGCEKYRLVDGERRYRAIMKLIDEGEEILRIKAICLSRGISETEMYIQQVMRNEGKRFNEYEYGILIQKLVDKCGLTMTEVSKRLGKNRGLCDYCKNHLERDSRIQELLRDNKVSGSTVRRIYSAHNNETDAVNEILAMAAKREDRINNAKTDDKKEAEKKKTITLRDLDKNSKTIPMRDTTAIRKGLELLFKYVRDYKNAGKSQYLTVDINDLRTKLLENKEKTINEIFDEIIEMNMNVPVTTD